jgi:hypothetical protein
MIAIAIAKSILVVISAFFFVPSRPQNFWGKLLYTDSIFIADIWTDSI